MDTTKIRLSPEEAALVIRADWILTKNKILQKANHLLGALQTQQQKVFDSYLFSFPEEIKASPKISKGENYKGLPYLILDYPRFFKKEDAFAIRTFFWWGNFFSCTLHLSGTCKTTYEKKIIDSFDALKSMNFFICISTEQWEHHFETSNYLPLQNITPSQFEKIISQRQFIKLSKKVSLKQWNDADKNLLEIFKQMISTLA